MADNDDDAALCANIKSDMMASTKQETCSPYASDGSHKVPSVKSHDKMSTKRPRPASPASQHETIAVKSESSGGRNFYK